MAEGGVAVRPEAVEGGTAMLVGTETGSIEHEVGRLLDDGTHYQRMAQRHNPFGDGRASERIADAIERYFQRRAPASASTAGATAAQRG